MTYMSKTIHWTKNYSKLSTSHSNDEKIYLSISYGSWEHNASLYHMAVGAKKKGYPSVSITQVQNSQHNNFSNNNNKNLPVPILDMHIYIPALCIRWTILTYFL